MMQKLIIKKFFQTLYNIEHGTLELTTPDGKIYHFFGTAEFKADIHIKDWRVVSSLLSKADIGFAESYRDGLFETKNLINILIFALKNEQALEPYITGNLASALVSRIKYFLRKNSLKGSKRNIHEHYDIGNDFYSLWLDPSMTYSSALFQHQQETLIEAQNNKYDRILSRLENPNGSLLEIGCGWGGFAARATEKYAPNLKAITISKQQHELAKQRLGQQAQVALEDYRQQNGRYDNIVSIEMFEAVGEKFWPIYFGKIKSLLKPKAKAIIQTITIDNHIFEKYRKSGDMIRTFIFPGGMLPSVEKFKEISSQSGLKMIDSYSFGQDYACTLDHWLSAFEQNLTEIKKMGFDDAFIRIWRFYLSVCIASFSVGRTNVMQAELVHA